MDVVMEQLSFTVESFEGPLDLLLSLIKKNEMDICNMQIHVIFDQYMEYFQQHKKELEKSKELAAISNTVSTLNAKEEIVVSHDSMLDRKKTLRYLDQSIQEYLNEVSKKPSAFDKEMVEVVHSLSKYSEKEKAETYFKSKQGA